MNVKNIKQFSRSFFNEAFPFVGTVALIFSFWEIAVDFLNVPAFILPSPFEIMALIGNDHKYFWQHGSVTFVEAVFGLGIAIIVGFCCSVTMSFVGKFLETATLPIIVAMQAIPIVALAPIFALWFGIGLVSKILLVVILCWFPIVISTTKGLASVLQDQLDVMRSFRVTRWQICFYLRLPSSVPFIFSGIKVAAGLSVIGAIVAEYSGANAGLGYVITQSSYRLDTVRLFGAIFCASVESLLLYGFFSVLELKIFRKYAIESG